LTTSSQIGARIGERAIPLALAPYRLELFLGPGFLCRKPLADFPPLPITVGLVWSRVGFLTHLA
jgi:hypothetical protein